MKSFRKIISFLLCMLLLIGTVAPMAVSAEAPTDELRGVALLNAYGLVTHQPAGGANISDAYIDSNGRMAVTAGGTSGNSYIGVNLGDVAGTLTSYTVEAKLVGVNVTDNWHYGIGWNNSQTPNAKNSFTMRSGTYTSGNNYGQLICNAVSASKNATDKMGQPSTSLADMSAANGQANIFAAKVVKGESNTQVTFNINGVTVHTSTETETYTLLDFNVVIPYGKTVAIEYYKVLDGSGNTVVYEDFSEKYSKYSAVEEFGVTVNTYLNAANNNNTDALYVNYDDELIIKTSGTKGNQFVSFDLPDAAKGLESYTLEATLKGVVMTDGWHYGISWNTASSNRAYYTMRSGAAGTGNQGQLLCYPKSGGNATYYLGNSANAANSFGTVGDAGVGKYITFKAVIDGTADTVTYYINNIEVQTLTSAEDALSNFSVMVPQAKTVAVDSVAVYDGNGAAVYTEDFVRDFEYIGTAIRFETPNGIRVKTSISADLTGATVADDGFEVVEYGTLVAKASDVTDTAMTVGAEKVKKAVAFDKAAGIDTYFERDAQKTVYTVALHGIADADAAYAFRAYYVVKLADETTKTFYLTYNGEANLTKTLRGVAQQIKNDTEEYNSLGDTEKAYILNLVPDPAVLSAGVSLTEFDIVYPNNATVSEKRTAAAVQKVF